MSAPNIASENAGRNLLPSVRSSRLAGVVEGIARRQDLPRGLFEKIERFVQGATAHDSSTTGVNPP